VPSQLVSAIDETPGLIVPVLVAFAALEAIPLDGTPIAHVPSVSIHLVYGCLAALLGVIIMYAAGDYWDRTVFNPRYGPRGRLVGKKTRLLLDATDLDNIRRAAAAKLPDVNRETQAGVYAAAEALLRDKGRWSEVEGPLVISKFVRSFIWPFLVAGLIMLLVAVLALSRRNHHRWSHSGRSSGGMLVEWLRFFCAVLSVQSPAHELPIPDRGEH
jgi:hypothetical protein